MNKQASKLIEGARVVGAIAAKDIADAVRNKNVLTVVLGVALLVLTSRALPLLLTIGGRSRAVVYEAGESGLIQALRNDDELTLIRARSQAELETILAEGTNLGLGLVIPADFGQAPGEEGVSELTGYAMHWLKPADLGEQVEILEEKIGAAAGRPVRIEVEGHILYPEPDAAGQLFMVTLALVIAIFVISVVVVPLLIVEEKESRTMDALLVSPATAGQVVAGKALAGLVYGLTAAAVVLAFNQALINLWGVALLSILAGVAFAVALGLLMGSLFENQVNLNVWTGLAILILLSPMLAVELAGARLPGLLGRIASWFPSVALSDLLRASFSQTAAPDLLLTNLAILLVSALALLLLTGRQLRRLEG